VDLKYSKLQNKSKIRKFWKRIIQELNTPQFYFTQSFCKWTTKTCSSPPIFTKLHSSYHLNSTQPDYAIWQSSPSKSVQPHDVTCHYPPLTKLINQSLPRHHLSKWNPNPNFSPFPPSPCRQPPISSSNFQPPCHHIIDHRFPPPAPIAATTYTSHGHHIFVNLHCSILPHFRQPIFRSCRFHPFMHQQPWQPSRTNNDVTITFNQWTPANQNNNHHQHRFSQPWKRELDANRRSTILHCTYVISNNILAVPPMQQQHIHSSPLQNEPTSEPASQQHFSRMQICTCKAPCATHDQMQNRERIWEFMQLHLHREPASAPPPISPKSAPHSRQPHSSIASTETLILERESTQPCVSLLLHSQTGQQVNWSKQQSTLVNIVKMVKQEGQKWKL